MDNTQKLSLKTPSWFDRNWKKSLLLLMVTVGVFAMAAFKISVVKHNLAFQILVYFTEAAAGVTVLAQALLRRVDEDAANKAFRYSLWIRGSMAVIGAAFFLEGCSFVTDGNGSLIAPFMKANKMLWSVFLTYEVGNAIMVLIEWMFSHLLQHDDFDARNELETSKGEIQNLISKIDSLSKDLEIKDKISNGLTALMEAIEKRHGKQAISTDDILSIIDSNELQLDKMSSLMKVIEEIMDGGSMSEDEIGWHPEKFHSVIHWIIEVSNKSKIAEKMAGIIYTARPNVRAFFCKTCFTYNEKGLKGEAICKKCNTKH